MRGAIAMGGLWGVFCGIVGGLPVASTLAQMAVPWICIAAGAANRAAGSTRQASLLGGGTLLAANGTYFAVGLIARASSGLPLVGGIRFFLLWTTLGLVIGPAAGVIGWLLTVGRKAFIAVVIMATVSIAEPLALWLHIDHFDSHLAYVGVAVAGFAFPLIWFRREWLKAVKALALMVVLTYPTAVILEVMLIALSQISRPMRLV